MTNSPLTILNNPYRDPRVYDNLHRRVLEEYMPGAIPNLSKYIPHRPTARQIAFLLMPQLEALYGGAAGGGKSDALLMAALQYVDVPGYAAILFRRTYADLERPGALIPRSHEWLRGTDAHWNGRRWTFPSGAVLDFGYLDSPADMYNYQSTEYQFVGFDELTQFQEQWYRYLFSRVRRRTDLPVPIRVRNATNPGGIGHDWVHRRFLVEGPTHDRPFLPARLDDNPHIDRTEYDRALQELDPVTYRMYRWGDWNVRPSGPFFNRVWFPLIDPEEVADARPIRMWDLAATKSQTSAYTAGALTSFTNGKMDIHEIRRLRGDPGEVEEFINATAREDGRRVHIHMEQEPGSGGVNTIHRYRFTVLQGYTFEAYVPKHDKLTRAAPLSALARHGGVRLVKGGRWIGPFLDEAESFPDGFKDQIDTCSASLVVHTQTPQIRIRPL